MNTKASINQAKLNPVNMDNLNQEDNMVNLSLVNMVNLSLVNMDNKCHNRGNMVIKCHNPGNMDTNNLSQDMVNNLDTDSNKCIQTLNLEDD